jgi:hypothetical protein
MTARVRAAFAILLFSAAGAAAQDLLAPVRDLYASAEYEQALTTLARLRSTADSTGVLEMDRYRVLCLIALGRPSEADQVIESIVFADPLYQPSPSEAAPRVRAAFSAVRRRVLPAVVRSLYADAKAAFDRKAFPEAIEGFDKTLRVMDDLEGGSENFSDLRLLAAGFVDLSRASLPAPPLPAAPAPAPAPIIAKIVPEPVAVPATPLSYANVVAKQQDLPPLPFSLARTKGEYRGTIEVDIDEHGNVVDTRLIQSIHVLYDPLLLKAAADWKYEPARVDGRPTAATKRVEIVLRP